VAGAYLLAAGDHELDPGSVVSLADRLGQRQVNKLSSSRPKASDPPVEPVGQRHRSTIRFSAREIVLLLLRRSNDGIVAADKTIKLSPSTSVLKHQVGDEIKLNEHDFVQVSQGSSVSRAQSIARTTVARPVTHSAES
jgi:hypothetical protein